MRNLLIQLGEQQQQQHPMSLVAGQVKQEPSSFGHSRPNPHPITDQGEEEGVDQEEEGVQEESGSGTEQNYYAKFSEFFDEAW